MTPEYKKILSIIPAPSNLETVFTGEPDEPGKSYKDQVACLALVEIVGGSRIVMPMIADTGGTIDLAEDAGGYIGLEWGQDRHRCSAP
jgi:hypothetical protein